MKLRYIYILLIASLMACENPDDFLDVKPTGQTIPTTLEDFDLMLNDYAILRERLTNIRFMDPDVYQSSASFSNINNYEGAKNINAYTWQGVLYTQDQDDPDYVENYYYIHVMNQILELVDDAPVGNFDPNKRNILKAEALAQRSMELFIQVNEYAEHYDASDLNRPGVPMPLEIDLQAQLGRSTSAAVYDQIIVDLNTALTLLPDAYPAINVRANFRPGKASIYALLAEVYLYMGDFENAKTYSDMALSLYSFLYDLNTIDFKDPASPWGGYNDGELEYSTFDQQVLWNRYTNWAFSSPFQLYSPDLVSLFDQANDRRWYLFATQVSNSGIDVSPDYIYMYSDAERNTGMTTPRLLLTNAEAKVRTGEGAAAITALNTLLQNRLVIYTPLTYVDDATTLQLIKDERRKELVGTGSNLFDQKRYHVLGEAVPTYTRTNPETGETFTLAPGDEGYVVSIPLNVQAINPNLN